MPNYTNSVWTEESETAPRHPRFRGTLHVDVAIVGGGITGITTACLLQRLGKRVAVIEARRVGKGETGKTTAHLSTCLDTRYQRLITSFGEEGARLVHRSQSEAIDRIEELARDLSIDCDFERVPGYLYSERRERAAEIEQEAEACRRLGIPAELDNAVPLPFLVTRGLRFRDQARFHPRAYLLGLAASFSGSGCHIFEDSQVTDVEEGEPCRVVTAEGVITAEHVVVAAHVPVSNKLFLHTKLAAYRTYAIGSVIDVARTPALFWDNDDPYHYIRTHELRERGPVLIVGGEDHKVGQEEDTQAPFARLERYAMARFGHLPFQFHWSGQIIESIDGLPYIGRNALQSRVYVATGYAGQGMTSGTLAGIILTDAIAGRRNPYADLYAATRMKPVSGAKEFLRENVDFPAHLIGDRLRRHAHPAIAEIAPGEGAVVAMRGQRLAVYRNHVGEVSALSPVCTHLGCLVKWNTTEKSWDCPCHGSRFDPTGRVLNGPALKALESRPIPEPPEAESPARVDAGTKVRGS